MIIYIFFLYTLNKLGANANTTTGIFGVVGCLSTLAFYNEYFLLGYFLFRLHIIIDMADGSIARAKKEFSDYADGYDKVNHILVNTSLILALSQHAEYYTTLLILPTFLVFYLFPKVFSKYPKGVNSKFNSKTKSLLKNIFSFEGFIIVCIINGYFLLNIQSEINILYALLFTLLSLAKFRYMYTYEK